MARPLDPKLAVLLTADKGVEALESLASVAKWAQVVDQSFGRLDVDKETLTDRPAIESQSPKDYLNSQHLKKASRFLASAIGGAGKGLAIFGGSQVLFGAVADAHNIQAMSDPSLPTIVPTEFGLPTALVGAGELATGVGLMALGVSEMRKAKNVHNALTNLEGFVKASGRARVDLVDAGAMDSIDDEQTFDDYIVAARRDIPALEANIKVAKTVGTENILGASL